MKKILIFLLFICFSANAQRVPQMIATRNSIADELNYPLRQNSIIHIYDAADGIIYPPDENGIAHHKNNLLSVSKIGNGVIGNILKGQFCEALVPRPAGGVKIFTRVFNRESVEESSFYSDSQLHEVSSTEQKTFYVNFNKTSTALDTRDFDNDQLNNSWEKALETDPFLIDTDGDSFTDYEEFICLNTDPNDKLDYLKLQIGSTNTVPYGFLYWNADPNVNYNIYSTTNTLQLTNLLWQTIVTNAIGYYEITNNAETIFFKLKVQCE